MKPPPFDYLAPATLADAIAALHDAQGTARVLAGGQSLLQDLRRRRLAPELLVDIARLPELRGITVEDGAVRIGALVRHADLERRGAVPGPLGELLAATARYIAHPPVRSRGTLVGSLARAHPASEWCALAAGLGGTVELAGHGGTRELPVADLLTGAGSTACAPDELIVAARLPVLAEGTGVAVAEQRRTHASYAQLVVTAAVLRDGDGVREARIGLGNAAEVAVRAHAAEAEIVGGAAEPGDLARAGAAAARDDADPVERPHAGVGYTRALVAVLVRRALQRAVRDTEREEVA